MKAVEVLWNTLGSMVYQKFTFFPYFLEYAVPIQLRDKNNSSSAE